MAEPLALNQDDVGSTPTPAAKHVTVVYWTGHLGFHPLNAGSNPVRRSTIGPVAQRTECPPPKRIAVGSNPTGITKLFQRERGASVARCAPNPWGDYAARRISPRTALSFAITWWPATWVPSRSPQFTYPAGRTYLAPVKSPVKFLLTPGVVMPLKGTTSDKAFGGGAGYCPPVPVDQSDHFNELEQGCPYSPGCHCVRWLLLPP